MKVILSVFCVQVILAITVPPRWPKTSQISYKNDQTSYNNDPTLYNNDQTSNNNNQTPYNNDQASNNNAQTPYKKDKISYKNPTVQSIMIPINSEQFKFHSFFPVDAKPSNTMAKLQYRSPSHVRAPNNQQLFVYHPQSNIKDQKYENHTPSSYQIVHFDSPNQDEIITTSVPRQNFQKQTRKGNYNQPIRQHLTEMNPPGRTFIPKQKDDGQYKAQQDIKEENIKENIKENTNENIEENKEENIEENIGENIGENIRENIEENMEESIEENAAEEIKNQKENISEHEFPIEIPTKPIYPGEGQWAKFGLKHRPYIRPNVEQVSTNYGQNSYIHPNIKSASTYKQKDVRNNQKDVQENIQDAQKNVQDVQEKVQDAQENVPEGYDTFEKGQEKFNQAQNNHRYNIQRKFPLSGKTHSENAHSENAYSDNTHSEITPSESNPTEIGFIPEKLYTQVRRTESEAHLPRSAINPDEENADRLRETIKDSKIHTVYTEEGYEDSAYDHAGHEKNAEDHEGHAENHEDESKKSDRGRDGSRGRYSGEGGRRYGGNNERRRLESSDKRKNEDYKNSQGYRKTGRRNSQDTDTAGSDYASKKINPVVIPSKNIKKVTLKNGKNEDIHMEIHTEVKYTPQKKKHKYIKIVPSPKKVSETSTIKSSTSESYTESPTTEATQTESTKAKSVRTESVRTNSSRTNSARTDSARREMAGKEYNTPLRRIKRYDKAKLSKMYKRQRPSYYWKKTRTTTTVRPIMPSRKKFEEAFQTHNSKVYEDYEDIPEEYIFKTSSMKRTTKPETTKNSKTTSNTKTVAKIITGTTTTGPTTKIPENIAPTEATTDKLISTKEKTTKTMSKSTDKEKKTIEKEKKTKEKTTQEKNTKDKVINEKTEGKTNENITTEESAILSSTPKQEDIHPDLLNPELTTRISKRSSPKTLPVVIRKFKAKRQKRFTNDFHKTKVDLTEFTDVRKFPDPVITPDMTHIKYPYYNLPKENLNENSPLRYSEDMKNIPKKVENELSFYESREHIVCPEIESDVNPIPERVQNQKEGEETDKMAESPNLPRLKGLGDKIDCLKEKYFGENPLDSPFFREEIIKEPEPFFSVKPFKHSTENFDTSPDYIAGNAVKRELKIKFLEPIVVLEEDLIESATINPIHQNTEAVLKPPYTLLEMMTMNQEQYVTPPRNIYDKISFLEQTDTSSDLPPEQFVIIYDNQENAKVPEQSTIAEAAQKKVKVVMSTSKPQTTTGKQQETVRKLHDTIRKPPIRKLPMPIKKLSKKTIRKPTPKTTQKPSTTTTVTIPTISTPVLPTIPSRQPTNHPETVTIQLSSSVVKPVVSPNNFITITTTPQTITDTPITVTAQLSPSYRTVQTQKVVRPNNWQTANRRIAAFYNIFDITKFLPQVPTHTWIRNEDQMNIHSDVLQNINNERETKDASDSRLEAVKVPVPQREEKDETTSKIADKNVESSGQSSETVSGMLPPSSSATYTTINSNPIPTEVQIQPEASQRLNYYYFFDMIAPNSNADISTSKHIVSKRDTRELDKKKDDSEDLIMEETKYTPTYTNIRRKPIIRQSEDEMLMDNTDNKPVYSSPPQRKPKVYTEIVRQRSSRPPEDIEEDEEEDLNPRKRVYQLRSSRLTTSTSKPASSEEDFIEDILEDTSTEPSEPTTTSKPIIYPVEANSKNSTVAEYIFFIEKLKEKWAKEDATSTTEATTTTKDPPKIISNQVTAESVNVRRGEPAYLQIITQLHDIRKDEDLTTSTTVPTTTEQEQPIKNSNPFIFESFMSELNSMKARLDPDSTAESTNTKSVDSESTDTEHRNRNFSTRFKTNIDTSKYKTIERAPVNVRHNLSSRFNSDDGLPLQKDKTTQMPMIIAIISRPTTKEPPKVEDKLEESARKEPKLESVQEQEHKTVRKQEQEVLSTTTIKPRQRGRSRRPQYITTLRPSTVTPSVTPVTPNPNFRRRRPTRVTTSVPPSTTSLKPETFRRRSRPKIITPTSTTSRNTKEDLTTESVVVVTPISSYKKSGESLESSEETSEPKKQRRFQKVQERRVMSEVTLTRFFEPGSEELDDNSEESRKHQYEVIGPLNHSDTRHGGNYKHEHDRKVPNSPEEDITVIPESVASSEAFFTDPKLAEDVNQLKEEKEASTGKKEASNILLTEEEIEDKVADRSSKVNLLPNVARMVNRLADVKSEEVSREEGNNKEDNNKDYNKKDDNKEEDTEKPTFIKDPSRRMYYYAKL